MSEFERPETLKPIETPAQANAFIEEKINEIRAQVGDKKVLLALSGGVDSSVVAALLNELNAVFTILTRKGVCSHINKFTGAVKSLVHVPVIIIAFLSVGSL